MQILLKSRQEKIVIDIFDIPAVKRWYDFFRDRINDSDYTFVSYFINDDAYLRRDQARDFIDQTWAGIISDIKAIQKIGYNVPFELPSKFNYDQQTLNLLHRFFTYNALWHHHGGKNPFDENFILPNNLSYYDWHAIIDPINVKVHDLEIYTDPSKNKKFITDLFPINDWYVRSTSYEWYQFSSDDAEHNYRFFDFSEHENLVMLDNSILGKSVLQSFYENDDPTCRDCTGRLGSYGGFIISKNNHRQQIYRSQNFADWCKKHDLSTTRLPYEFVIGKAQSIPKNIDDSSFVSADWSIVFQ